MNFKKNQILDVDIEEVNMMGFGVAKEQGMVIFVQNAVTGERDRVKLIKCTKNYCVARVEEVLTPSDMRQDPPCPHYKRCGGCSFQHISYEYEKTIKRNWVRRCLNQSGLSHVEVREVLSVDKISRYRNKAQYPIARDCEGKIVAGFYSPKSHSVCPIEDCLIQEESFSSVCQFFCRFLQNHGIEPYCEETREGLVRHLYLRIGKKTGEMMVCVVLKSDYFPEEDLFVSELTRRFPTVKSVVFNINPEQTNVILGPTNRLVFGQDHISEILCERKLLLSASSFFQVNRDAAELLYNTAFKMVPLSEYDLIVDLYCGIGSIALCSGTNAPIIGVEIVPQAIENAKRNAKINGIQNAIFLCGDASLAFESIDTSSAKNPLLILDPPRKGLSRELVDEICAKKLPSILYISCGPDTLARDLALFSQKGYHFDYVQPVDLFPRTSHVESVCLLSKK